VRKDGEVPTLRIKHVIKSQVLVMERKEADIDPPRVIAEKIGKDGIMLRPVGGNAKRRRDRPVRIEPRGYFFRFCSLILVRS